MHDEPTKLATETRRATLDVHDLIVRRAEPVTGLLPLRAVPTLFPSDAARALNEAFDRGVRPRCIKIGRTDFVAIAELRAYFERLTDEGGLPAEAAR